MNRPLIITDCDEVLLHMLVPFREWLDEAHGVHFDFRQHDFVEALRHKESGIRLEREHIWSLLTGFFETEMHRQKPISGAMAALARLGETADIVVLTNIAEAHQPLRSAQLAAHGLHVPVFCNQGGKGPQLTDIVAARQPCVTLFIDDIGGNHRSVAEHAPDVWRLHMVGEPDYAPFVEDSRHAHARIDDWSRAEGWIADRLAEGPAPADAITLNGVPS